MKNVNGRPPRKHKLLTYFERLNCLFSTHEILVFLFTILLNTCLILEIQLWQRCSSESATVTLLLLFRPPIISKSLLKNEGKDFYCSENFMKLLFINLLYSPKSFKAEILPDAKCLSLKKWRVRQIELSRPWTNSFRIEK